MYHFKHKQLLLLILKMSLDPFSQNFSKFHISPTLFFYLPEPPDQFFPIFSLLSLTSFCWRGMLVGDDPNPIRTYASDML